MSIRDWEKREQDRKDVGDDVKKVIWEAMKHLGISRIEIDYCGSGDSGHFEGPVAFSSQDESEGSDVALTKKMGEHEVTFKAIVGEYDQGEYVERIVDITKPLEEAVDAVANTLLDWTHGGWEINEGSRGNFVFNLSNKEIVLNHESYYTESHHYENTWHTEE